MRIMIFMALTIAIIGCTPQDELSFGSETSSSFATTLAATTGSMSEEPIITEQLQPADLNEAISTATTSTIEATPSLGIAPTSQVTDIASMTPEPQITSTSRPQALGNRKYLRVAELSPEHYVEFVTWGDDGRHLIYALQGTWATNNVPFFEPKDWYWWQFDPVTGENAPLAPPGSDIDLETRQALGLCTDRLPEEITSEGCAGSRFLDESPYGDHIVYNPIARGENTWMANKDGSNVMELDGVSSAQNAHWSSDGQWVLVSVYGYRAPGMEIHYLIDIEDGDIRELGALTGHTLTFVNFLRPQFSPDGRFLVYAATENQDLELESGYGLYLLDMKTLQSKRFTDHFGPFQWEADSQGLFVLDNATYPIVKLPGTPAPVRKSALYHVDISDGSFQESLLFGDIDYFPRNSPSAWHWAYSPEAHAISLVGLNPETELGILLLSP